MKKGTYDYNYVEDEHGVLLQVSPDPFEYTDAYMDVYHSIGEEGLTKMSRLRFENICDSIGFTPESILDIGYGSGSFLKYCAKMGVKAFGNDICKYKMPPWTMFAELDDTSYDVITMFDTLEHFHDVSFLDVIKPKYLVITVPWLPHRRWAGEQFQNWKHRKPNEHIRHFDIQSLKCFIESYGYNMMYVSNIEDRIRRPDNIYGHPNILTEIFKRIE